MKNQLEFNYEQNENAEWINALSEEQSATIRAALETLFNAALCLYEETQDAKRKD